MCVRILLAATCVLSALTAFGDASVPRRGSKAATKSTSALPKARMCGVAPSPRDVQRLDSLLVGALQQVAQTEKLAGGARDVLKHLSTDFRFYTVINATDIQVDGVCAGFMDGAADRRGRFLASK